MNEQKQPAVGGQVDGAVRPRAWLCELAQEDGTTRTQFVEQDPDGLRWNDAGEPSPYRTTPLYALDAKDVAILGLYREQHGEALSAFAMATAKVRASAAALGETVAEWQRKFGA
jgi:hypothetical protein